MKCFLCGFKAFQSVYKTNLYTIIRCQTCGVFTKQARSQSTERLYDTTYYNDYPYSNSLSLTKRYFKTKIEKIKKLVGKRKPSILDVGCGWGDFLEVARGESLPYFGIDHSPVAIKKCQDKNLHVAKMTLHELISQKKQFDVITGFQTIEHVKNPIFFLESAYKILASKGIILLTTPNNHSPLRFFTKGKWSVYNTSSHFVFFDKKTLRQTLEKAGFADVSVHLDIPRFFSLHYILSRVRPEWKIFYRVGVPTGGGPKAHASRLKRGVRFGTREGQAPQQKILDVPIPTDPFGDLIAIGFKR